MRSKTPESDPLIDQVIASADRLFALRGVWVTAIVLILVGQSLLIVSHAAWPDEWQALLIALQSPSPAALVQNLRYEGHPPLWYGLLLGIAAAGVPTAWVLAVAQLIVATATKLLLLVAAPFGRAERLLLALSYLILFEYGVVARGYGLGVLLMLVALAARDRRIAWGAVALLPLVDFHFGIVSLIGLAMLWCDRRWSWWGAGTWLAASLLAAWTVLPPADVVPAVSGGTPALRLGQSLVMLGNLLFHLPIGEGLYWWEGTLPFGLGAGAGALFLILGHRVARASRGHLIVYWGFVAAVFAFAAVVYPLATRTGGLIAILIVGLAWRDASRGIAPGKWFRWWLVASAASGLIAAGVAAVRPFDNVGAVAAYLARTGQQDELIAAYPVLHGVSLTGMTGRETLPLSKGCLQSFVRWDAVDRIEAPQPFAAAVRANAARYGRHLLLVRGDLSTDLGNAFDPALMRLEARFAPGMDGRRYVLYRIGDDVAPTGRTPPRCAPTDRLSGRIDIGFQNPMKMD